MKHKVVDLNNKVIDEIEIKDSIFCINIFPDIIHNYIKYQMSKKRSGNHKTKTRSEVRGKSKKDIFFEEASALDRNSYLF